MSVESVISVESDLITPTSTPLFERVKGIFNRMSTDQWVMGGVLILAALLMIIGLIAPLGAMFVKSVQDRSGEYIGFANYVNYLNNPALTQSIYNTLFIGIVVSAVVGLLAFCYAYALTRTCMPAKRLFKLVGSLPILAPSLLPAISLVYLFGNQGIWKSWLMGSSIYGPIGIVLGLVFWCFPHALLIMSTGLSTADARLYEAARVMRTSPIRTFFTITLPGAKYGLMSAMVVIFTLVVCDFGVAKVIGGQYNVLATDIYKQVIGQHNFAMGAVTSVVLLLPALLSFALETRIRKKQQSMMSANSVIYQPTPNKVRDRGAFVFCLIVATAIMVVIGMAFYGSLISFWPYNKALTLGNYDFGRFISYGWAPFYNSVKMALLVALIGTLFTFLVAYCVEKGREMRSVRSALHLMAMMPMAVPGMVLGLGYIFFFNSPTNPMNNLYGTMTILVVCTVVHLYTVGHMTALTALRQIPAEIEAVAASLKIPQYKAFLKISIPVGLPALLDIGSYLFVNAMTTTSGVIFLYTTDNVLASIAVMHLDEMGYTAAAAAMAVMIMLTSAIARLIHGAFSHLLLKRTQRWRTR
ncbi:putative 2-aminoethylphosphonate ABC transporter permease subunit [Photobacterium sp. DNB23_23_1]|uniref:2-aminoethylphosphonate ABC transporter permease subunit n=1 Tax=Photobacterium pectinilyticum TaxID=2906793 RepID=A0ABT1MYX1_9GAMM|nr:putative 2-aminoethylphosphonate ABC transporter permease subunit [Photobacterium sp. ZSDE20]MCQ1057680.1 putative 2-aminoethylphosphonate ABC transporter permease subunit [Photobacterium sp. ZSDE20]MDD1822109.1 putative 2-aminoethylphosphonate ABC transporter permease subunit [Photobacterium sp. ZSDE20]